MGTPTRRQVLGLLGATAILPAATDPPEAFPTTLTMIVAGPAGGGLDADAAPLLTGLQSHLPTGTTLGRSAIGGVDGVTGANRFASFGAPDGAAALLLPGSAPIAWLVGDSRVHFDPSHWVPVLAGLCPAVVVGHRGASLGPIGARLRVASGGPASPSLAALLALDLLGATVVPVPGLDDEPTAIAALGAGRVDAVLLRSAPALNHLGGEAPFAAPWFGLSVPDAGRRDPLSPDTPSFAEFADALHRTAPPGPRVAAFRCAAVAARLRYALVLPTLTPPSAVALWRDAGSRTVLPTTDDNARILHALDAAQVMRAMTPDSAALLDVRTWLNAKTGLAPV